ncbi:MAG TPA: hypothetical protein VKM55_23130 [Candidatus Lokiarchaeia archaeon]|nr:hypothetical protein [Candidatus Lokiarchaeia archaeon]
MVTNANREAFFKLMKGGYRILIILKEGSVFPIDAHEGTRKPYYELGASIALVVVINSALGE